jgi:hypothetical protein
VSDSEEGTDKEKSKGSQPRQDEVSLEPAGEVVVIPETSLPKPPEDKRIHPRRPLPPIPDAPAEGKEDGDQ